jgi:tetratricopeptide (TPR) repeat protein
MRQRRGETKNARAWEHYLRAKQIHEDFVAYMRANGIAAAERSLNKADSLARLAASEDRRWIAPVLLRGKLAAQRVQVVLFSAPPESRSLIRSSLDQAIQHASRAISIDRKAPDGYELRGTMRYRLRLTRLINDSTQLRKNDSETETDLLQAISFDSTRAEAWSTLSELYMSQSRFVEARRAAQRAYESDRYLGGAYENLYRLAVSSFETNNDHDARKWCTEGRRRFPHLPQFVYCQLMLMAWADTVSANVDSAWALVRLTPGLLPSAPGDDTEAMFKLMVASVIARAGEADSARKVITRTLETAAPSPALLWVEAAARARVGDFARADSLLDRYNATVGFPALKYWICGP